MQRPGVGLPRSVHLAVWIPHVDDPADVRTALAAVEQDDEPHTVSGVDGVEVPGPALADLLVEWGGTTSAVAASLPVPGDVGGVPATVSAHAVDAGEAVLVDGPMGPHCLVPEIVEFGSVHEIGHMVTWQVHASPPWALGLVGALGSVNDAEGELRSALLTATEALDSLDVARWRPDAAEVISSLRSPVDPGWRLPTGMDQRRARVIALAARLRTIIGLTAGDSGGAVNQWQADQRAAALHHIDDAARRAMAAATLVMVGHSTER